MSQTLNLFKFEIGKENLNIVEALNFLSNQELFALHLDSCIVTFNIGNSIESETLKSALGEIFSVNQLLLSFKFRSSRIVVDPYLNSDFILIRFTDYKKDAFGMAARDLLDNYYEFSSSYKNEYEMSMKLAKLNSETILKYQTSTQEYFTTRHPIVINELPYLLKIVDPRMDLLNAFLKADFAAQVLYVEKYKAFMKNVNNPDQLQAEYNRYLRDTDSLWDDAFGDSQDSAIGRI